MYRSFNANPDLNRVGDCTVRAISFALNQSWETTFIEMAIEGLIMSDMPSANHVWGAYLRRKGFKRRLIPESCPDQYTVRDFCRDNPKGVYILALSGHVVPVVDGNYYDTWDSGDKIPLYYWMEEEKK